MHDSSTNHQFIIAATNSLDINRNNKPKTGSVTSGRRAATNSCGNTRSAQLAEEAYNPRPNIQCSKCWKAAHLACGSRSRDPAAAWSSSAPLPGARPLAPWSVLRTIREIGGQGFTGESCSDSEWLVSERQRGAARASSRCERLRLDFRSTGLARRGDVGAVIRLRRGGGVASLRKTTKMQPRLRALAWPGRVGSDGSQLASARWAD